MRYFFVFALIVIHYFYSRSIIKEYKKQKSGGKRVLYYVNIATWVVTALMLTQYFYPWCENYIFGFWFLLLSIPYWKDTIEDEDLFRLGHRSLLGPSLVLTLLGIIEFAGGLGMGKYLLHGDEPNKTWIITLEDIAHEYDYLQNYYESDSSQWQTMAYLSLIIHETQDEQDRCQVLTIGSYEGNIGYPILNDSSALMHLGYAALPQTTLSIYAQTSVDSTTVATLLGNLHLTDSLVFHSTLTEPLDTAQYIFVINKKGGVRTVKQYNPYSRMTFDTSWQMDQ